MGCGAELLLVLACSVGRKCRGWRHELLCGYASFLEERWRRIVACGNWDRCAQASASMLEEIMWAYF